MNNILFYDTETTGKADFRAAPDAPQQPRLVQLAAILTTPENELVEEFCCVIKPDGWKIDPEAEALHGITLEYANEYGIPVAEALRRFEQLAETCKGKVCHNSDFDSRIMMGEQIRGGIVPNGAPKPHFCTMKAMTKICQIPNVGRGGFKWPKLAEAYQFCTGKELKDGHDAMIDAQACRAIYFWMKFRGQSKQTA